ncbi:Hypothetical predicted protein [Marmota monax]|uniref:Secreted protein n=1 Tax=Marmota monax TaxID=9995 RepID=A0A5E4DAV8_MARMO|nr:Hypothetical predicted protein [Marmota monax]
MALQRFTLLAGLLVGVASKSTESEKTARPTCFCRVHRVSADAAWSCLPTCYLFRRAAVGYHGSAKLVTLQYAELWCPEELSQGRWQEGGASLTDRTKASVRGSHWASAPPMWP